MKKVLLKGGIAAVIAVGILVTGSMAAPVETWDAARLAAEGFDFETNYDNKETDSIASDLGQGPNYGGDNLTRHNTSEWNQLGLSSTANDGVFWSTDDGATWKSGSQTNLELSVGDTIDFKIGLWSSGYGNHNYDQALLWVDTNGNDLFEASEWLINEQFFKAEEAQNGEATSDVRLTEINWNKERSTMNFYLVENVLVTEEMLAGFHIRARATCNHPGWPLDDAYVFTNQGEIEQYYFTVSTPIPEPTTMLLFGTGLAGFAALARRKK